MIYPTLLGLFTVFFAAFFSRLFKADVAASVFLFPVFVFWAMRYGYGNDYFAYLNMFQLIQDQAEGGYRDSGIEIGWYYINLLFSDAGFFAFVAALSFFTYCSIARFISRFVSPGYYWLAGFIFIFIPDNFLIQTSAMRQTLAISIFLYSIEYIVERKILHYFCFVALATIFHTSAAVLFFLYFVGGKNLSIRSTHIPILIAGFFSVFFISDHVVDLAFRVLGQFDEIGKYSEYKGSGVLGSGLGVAFQVFLLIASIFVHDKLDRPKQILLRIAILGFFVIPLSSSLMIIGRLGFYFSAVHIAAIPAIVSVFRRSWASVAFLTIYFVYAFFLYFSFFSDPVWVKSYSDYVTIFSATADQ